MNLRRADRNLAELTVLTLLSVGPRHTYDMHREIVATHKDFVTGLPRSMYHAVDRLLRNELIAAADTVRHGARPERIVYRITDEGRAALGDRLHRLLAVPDRDTTLFVAALSFIGCLAPEGARTALLRRAQVLEEQVSAEAGSLSALRDQLPRLLIVETEYEHERHAAELRWVRNLLADLDSGVLEWPADLTDRPLPQADL